MQSKDDFDAANKALSLLNQISLERGKAAAKVTAIAEAMVRIAEQTFGPDRESASAGVHGVSGNPQGCRVNSS